MNLFLNGIVVWVLEVSHHLFSFFSSLGNLSSCAEHSPDFAHLVKFHQLTFCANSPDGGATAIIYSLKRHNKYKFTIAPTE